MPNHTFIDDMFGPIFDSMGVSPRNNPTKVSPPDNPPKKVKTAKEKLEEKRDGLRDCFNKSEGQTKFDLLMALSAVEAQLKKLQ